MATSSRTPSLRGQLLTCLLLVALALIITTALHPKPLFSHWTVGQPIAMQLTIAGVFALLCTAGASIALRIPYLRRYVRVPDALQKIDLSGERPWVVGLCAGVGEELLFRAALQPLVGLWLGAILFAAAHMKTAALGSSSSWKRLAYILNVAVAGVALGLVFEHLGLLAAVLIHATIDIVGLLVYRSLSVRSPQQSAA